MAATIDVLMSGEEEVEEKVIFNQEHYPEGVNADFLRVGEDGVSIIAKFGGSEKGKGIFEDAEHRDIAAAVPDVISMLQEKTPLSSNGIILDVGAGTGLFLEPLSTLVPNGQLFASDISPEFRCHLNARIEKEQLQNVRIIEADTQSAAIDDKTNAEELSSSKQRLPLFNLVLMIDVYHHLEYPRTICRKLRKQMSLTDGRLIVIDFHRDPVPKTHFLLFHYGKPFLRLKVTSRPPEWVLQHLRAGQDEFRAEILSSGFVLVEEPLVDTLKENYVMIFRPCTDQETATQIGAGWADKTISTETPPV